METSGTVVTSSVSQPVEIDASLLSLPSTGYSQGLEQFLEKPVVLSSILWNTQSVGATLGAWDFPTATLTQAIHKNKISGFLGFRGTLVLRVQLNANPMMSGRLILSFVPLAQEPGMFIGLRYRSLQAITQLPNVQIDAASQTECILEIPYINPFSHYDLTNGQNLMGTARLSVYAPLRYGTGDSTAEITVWASWKNVELVTPTYNAQMGAIKRSVKKNKGGAIAEAEATEAGAKPFSSAMSAMGSVASSFAAIPALTAIAQPASWVLNAIGGIASAFGYSKPANSTPPTRIINFSNVYAGQCDGVSSSQPLGLSVDNKVGVLPGFAGTDVDETNISHFVSIPTYYSTTSWTTSTAVSSVLLQIPLEPAEFCREYTFAGIGTENVKDLSPMALMAAVTKYYRGSIGLNIKIAKTGFHSGRLLVAYSPGWSPPTTVAHTDYCYREIIDIRENNEWQFVFPFASTRTWMTNPLATRSMATAFEPYGYVTIFVLNPLRAPSTVSTTVDFIVEAFGASDLEFSVPRPTGYLRPTTLDYAPQMADSLMPAVQKPIGSSSLSRMEIAPSEFCIGEKLTSILQLCKRETEVFFRTLNPISNVAGISIKPTSIGAYKTVSGGATQDPFFFGDMYNIFAGCFLLSRGSTRITFVPVGTGNFTSASETWIDAATDVATSITPVVTGAPTIYANRSTVRTFVGDYPVSVLVPQYTPGHSRLNRFETSSDIVVLDQYESRLLLATTVKAVSLKMYRSLGDDAAMGYFIGVPPVLLA